jgi:SAM-dependent methyltransferase
VEYEQLLRRKAEVVERHGGWRHDNIHLGAGVFTIAPGPVGREWRVEQVLQIAGDLVGGSFEGLRVLDLGAGEGMFALELAAKGAEVVALEARQASVEKIAFAAEALGLDGVEAVRDDVRNVSRERYGAFDLVLCLGILYHLDAPDVFDVASRMAGVCRRAAIVETHFSLRPRTQVRHDGGEYWGLRYREHDPGSGLPERAAELRASIDNPESFWPTRPSLYNLLADAGFSSVLETRIPRYAGTSDRTILVAFRGRPPTLHAVPRLPGGLELRWAERESTRPLLLQRGPLFRAVRRITPAWLRRALG